MGGTRGGRVGRKFWVSEAQNRTSDRLVLCLGFGFCPTVDLSVGPRGDKGRTRGGRVGGKCWVSEAQNRTSDRLVLCLGFGFCPTVDPSLVQGEDKGRSGRSEVLGFRGTKPDKRPSRFVPRFWVLSDSRPERGPRGGQGEVGSGST